MTDFKLNSCGDLAIENGDIVLVSGTAEVVQHILFYLRTGLEEYFFDTTKGIAYIKKIFTKRISKNELQSIFRDVCNGIEGVRQTNQVILKEYNPTTRNIKIDLDITLEETLERTVIGFTGILPTECTSDATFPSSIPDLSIWFDAQDKSVNNKAGQGSYSLVGNAELKGQTELDLNNKAIDVTNNTAGTTQNYISFVDTQFIDSVDQMTLFWVVRANELFDGTDLPIFSLSGFGPLPTRESQTLSIELKDSPTTPQIKIKAYKQSSTSIALASMPQFQYQNFVLAIKMDSFGYIYFNGDFYSATPSIPSPDITSGNGWLMAGMDKDGVFNKSFNGIFGEFLLYRRVLTDNQIASVSSWLSAKWNLQ